MGLHLSQIDEAEELLTNDPLALLIGMVLDQRVSERTSGTTPPSTACPAFTRLLPVRELAVAGLCATLRACRRAGPR